MREAFANNGQIRPDISAFAGQITGEDSETGRIEELNPDFVQAVDTARGKNKFAAGMEYLGESVEEIALSIWNVLSHEERKNALSGNSINTVVAGSIRARHHRRGKFSR